ncbi:MAG: hypothetical protein MI924_34960 [Chloroflexales bacterium]|nr:hypothetical protein [Chloroflexales bacterium]
MSPPLNDDQLSAALDQTADTAVMDHLTNCQSCAERLAQAKSVEHALGRKLWRWDCPPPELLAEYHFGSMEISAERPIRLHLEQCTLCKSEIEDLRQFLQEIEPKQLEPQPAPSTPVARPRLRVGEILARLLPRQPAQALRGSSAGPITAEADGITIYLDVQPAARGEVTINGQIIGDNLEQWAGALVELRRGSELQAVTSADDLGGFYCGPLAAGVTFVRVTPEYGSAVVIPDIVLTP